MRGGNPVLHFTTANGYRERGLLLQMKYAVGEWKELFFSSFFLAHLPLWVIYLFCLIFIRLANIAVPSMQRNCFTGCDSKITWWQQSNFHMNNYPAVRVGSSFISIWWTRRIVLANAASEAIVFRALGTGRGLTDLGHFSSILLLWPKYANTFNVGPRAKHSLLTRRTARAWEALVLLQVCWCVF